MLYRTRWITLENYIKPLKKSNYFNYTFKLVKSGISILAVAAIVTTQRLLLPPLQ